MATSTTQPSLKQRVLDLEQRVAALADSLSDAHSRHDFLVDTNSRLSDSLGDAQKRITFLQDSHNLLSKAVFDHQERLVSLERRVSDLDDSPRFYVEQTADAYDVVDRTTNLSVAFYNARHPYGEEAADAEAARLNAEVEHIISRLER